MPLFDYECRNCGAKVSDVLVKVPHHEHISLACPSCKKLGSLQKLPSKASFSVKGYSYKNGYSGGK